MGVLRKSKASRKISTIEMEVSIARYFGHREHIIVPNLSWGFFSHECDLFLIRKSGFGFEVEIKRTKSDMVADFKKNHGHVDRKNRIVQLFYAFPEELLPKVKHLIPKECGIITVTMTSTGYCRASMKREAKRKKGAKRLTETEQLKIARLGTMRVWSCKERIVNLLQ